VSVKAYYAVHCDSEGCQEHLDPEASVPWIYDVEDPGPATVADAVDAMEHTGWDTIEGKHYCYAHAAEKKWPLCSYCRKHHKPRWCDR
jgi:hypothetical protein